MPPGNILNTINNELAVIIDEFTIYFEPDKYENLASPLAQTLWGPLVIQPDNVPFPPSDGFYDALATFVSGITLGGFVVRFDYLVSGMPGPQFFEIFDPVTFDIIDSGDTMPVAVVPVPAAVWLFGTGILGLIGFSRKAA